MPCRADRGARAKTEVSSARVLTFQYNFLCFPQNDDDDTLTLAVSIRRNAASHMYAIIQRLCASWYQYQADLNE